MALEPVQCIWASSRGEGGHLIVFLELQWDNLGFPLELWRRYSLTLVFSQRCQDSCLDSRDTSGFSSSHGRAVGMPLELRKET